MFYSVIYFSVDSLQDSDAVFQTLLNTVMNMNTCYGPTMSNMKIIVLWDQVHWQKDLFYS